MEIKKSPKADLQNKRGLLLEIGLAISLLAVVVAFSLAPSEKRIEELDLNLGPIEEEITEITRQDQKPPEPPKKVEIKVLSDIIEVMKNDTKISTEINFDEFDEDTNIEIAEVEEEEIEDNPVFVIVEDMPKVQGGDLNTFRNWVQKQVKYPTIALENGITGRVVLTFVVEKDGSLTNIEVLQTPDRSLAEEATRVLKQSPKWTPGKQRNQAVRVKYTLPVEFRVQN